ncbi:unnamed protein product [Larinioides sclopetarius]|uniref:Speckle-type POZ protein n=1 Tax=Larinioides sclopetarius TaxID=280406 RepID=A0AAV2B5A1_9ARAC
MNNRRKECTFLWFIENYSYCLSKNGKSMLSPKFTSEELDGTDWILMLYPKGRCDYSKDHVSLFLGRYANDAGPEDLSVKYELSLLAGDQSSLLSRDFEFTFQKCTSDGAHQLVQTSEIHLQRKAEYLPNDTLSVRCKIWKGEGDVLNTEQITVRTRIITTTISFLHVVENFSKLQPNVKNTVKVQPRSKKRRVFLSNLYFTNDSCCEETITIEILLSDAKQILRKCKLSLIEASGNMIDCGTTSYGYDATRGVIFEVPLTLTREVVTNKKSEYLPNDKLSLLCECTFLTGIKTETIEETRHELPMGVKKQKTSHVHNVDVYKPAETISGYPSASDDIKALYINKCLTDIKLKTKTKSFRAHKIMLCARSPAFKAILTSNVKEKNNTCIHVDDLENDTVEQLLLFLYTDNLENLHCKRATQLYYAAHKYQIEKLKAICSSFLAENLCSSNATAVLLLADTHNDSNLKRIVEDFILKHEDQVFGSNDWEKLIETNPQLVINTMHLKYKRKKNELN